MMKRRTVLSGLTALAPVPAIGQALRRIGVIMAHVEADPLGKARGAALVRGLKALGWRDGENLVIDWHWAGGDAALFARAAADLKARGVAVVVAMATPSVRAMKRETDTIPIVFVQVVDPVGQQFVQSLAKPGGNITGVSNYDSPMVSKWLQMLTQITPTVRRVSPLFNPTTAPTGLFLPALREAAQSLSLEMKEAPCRDDAEIETATAKLAGEEQSGVVVLPEPFTSSHRDAIMASIARHRLPAVYPFRYWAADGGLMAYGMDEFQPFERAATFIDRILKGARPGDLPVERPTKYNLVVNLKTAKAMGFTLSPALLAAADEVIE
jgi:putative ABC transport system substrate-binding protein